MYSGLLFLGGIDLSLRYFWLERAYFTCNTGIFWGIEASPVLLWLGIGGIFVWCFWLFMRWKERMIRWALGAILTGGTINVLDRLVSGCVLDYFHWPLGLPVFFPNFNLSDSVIFFGLLVLFLWHVLTKECKEENIDY